MKQNSYEVYEDKLNIIGFRNKFGSPDYFDDTIAVYYKFGGQWVSFFFEATTKPGIPSLLNPPNPKGTAILVAGQYTDSYMLGLHKGKYEALVQRRPVKVYRDNTKDLMYNLDQRTVEEGFYGINIHHASAFAKLVGRDSAGCQVIKNLEDYESFIELCKEASKSQNNEFTYTLVEI